MSLNLCKDCELINNILKNKYTWYNELSEENVSKHRDLLHAYSTIQRMQNVLSQLHITSLEERCHNLIMYMDKEINSSLSTAVRNKKGDYEEERFNKLINDIHQQKMLYDDLFAVTLNEIQLKEYQYVKTFNKLHHDYVNLTDQNDTLRKHFFKVIQQQQEEYDNLKIKLRDNELRDKQQLNEKLKEKFAKLEEDVKNIVRTIEKNQTKLLQCDEVVHKLLKKNDKSVEKLLIKKQVVDEVIEKYKEQIKQVQKELNSVRSHHDEMEKKRLRDGKQFIIQLENLRKRVKAVQIICKPTVTLEK